MRTLPSSLLEKIQKLNQTIYENAQPQMLIDIYKTGMSVSELDMWYVETIREKEGLGDIAFALKRTNPNKGASDAYEIHVDNGIVKTATKSLKDFSKSKWADAFTVGAGSAVAIEFDGYWVMDKLQRYNLITDDVPYLFWVDAGTLYYQLWDNINIKDILSTDVVKVAALRGWKNIQVPTDDQGLIVAYTKTDGKLYYRNYTEQSNGTTIWEVEKEITCPAYPADDINIFRTNDYRVGFIAESGGNIYWILTERCWAGMAVPPETLTAKFGGLTTLNLIGIEYADIVDDYYLTGSVGLQAIGLCTESAVAGKVTKAQKTGTNEITLTFSCPVVSDLNRLKHYLLVTDMSMSVTYTISTIIVGSTAAELKITLTTDLDMENDALVTYTDLGMLFTRSEPYAMLKIASFSIVVPIIINPVHIVNLKAQTNVTALTFIEVFYSEAEPEEEHLTCKFNGFTSVIFTKVGTGDI